jgi:hypothetical protein
MLPFIPPHVCAFVCETQRDLFPMHAALLFHSLIVNVNARDSRVCLGL